jgi:phosphate/sulfate permease
MSIKTNYHKISGLLIIGVLPGFIWGWFHVPDNYSGINWQTVASVYTMPVTGGAVSLFVYIILSQFIKGKNERLLINCFAAAAVSCYYWFRIPELFGFGNYEGDGLLINLKEVLPQWSVTGIILATTIFFFVWLTVRRPDKKSWVLRPRFAEQQFAE